MRSDAVMLEVAHSNLACTSRIMLCRARQNTVHFHNSVPLRLPFMLIPEDSQNLRPTFAYSETLFSGNVAGYIIQFGEIHYSCQNINRSLGVRS